MIPLWLATLIKGGDRMTKKSSGKGRAATGVTPQGTSEDAEFAQDPKTELENRAKKSNTKR
jgi:small acid-soluble spore protein L (minor)